MGQCGLSKLKPTRRNRNPACKYSTISKIMEAEASAVNDIAKLTMAIGKTGIKQNEETLYYMTQEEKRQLKVTLCGVVLNKCPNFYSEIWVRSIEKAPKIAAIIGIPRSSYQQLSAPQQLHSTKNTKSGHDGKHRTTTTTTNNNLNEVCSSGSSSSSISPQSPSSREKLLTHPRVLKVAQKLDMFFEKICYEYDVDPFFVAETAFLLGQKHYHLLATHGMQPLYFDILFSSLIEILDSLDYDNYCKETVCRAWTKLTQLVSEKMTEGYQDGKKSQQALSRLSSTTSNSSIKSKT